MRWLGALLLSLWFAACAQAQVTFVQKAVNGSTSAGTSISVTVTAIGSGHFVVGSVTGGNNGVGCNGSGGPTLSIKDNNSVAGTIIDTLNDSTNSQCLWTFYFANVTNGATSYTGSFGISTGANLGIEVQEWSGIGTSTPLDGHNAGMCTSSTTCTSPTTTPTTNGDLIYGAIVQDTGGSTITGAGGSFTIRTNDTAIGNADESQVQATAAAIGASFTQNAAQSLPVAVAAFKAASGGGATCPMTRALMGVGC